MMVQIYINKIHIYKYFVKIFLFFVLCYDICTLSTICFTHKSIDEQSNRRPAEQSARPQDRKTARPLDC